MVNVYNICYAEDREILKKSKTLREYSMFVSFVNEYLYKGMSREDAIENAVKKSKKEGVLVDFLNKYATEVIGMLTGITVEKYGEVMKREGFEDGKAEGLAEGKFEMARAMKAKDYSVDEIVELTGLSAGEIKKL